MASSKRRGAGSLMREGDITLRDVEGSGDRAPISLSPGDAPARTSRLQLRPGLSTLTRLEAGQPRGGLHVVDRGSLHRGELTEGGMKIEGARVMVTGGGRGIGWAFAELFLKAGAKVMVCDVSADDLRKAEAAAAGRPLRTAQCDVSKEADVQKAFAAMVEAWGGVDVLVNNAGITRDSLFLKVKDGEIATMSLANWQKVVDVNLTGTFLCSREAATWMVKQKNSGVIVNISSISREGNMGQTNYSATKAGVVAMTVALAKELARYDIRVAAIAPGYTATEMVLAMREEMQDKVKKTIPLGRFATTEEIASTALFIVQNDYVTGRLFEVDGGLRL
jgi:3-oxoacyl-[acyl-carrier protein] reductase